MATKTAGQIINELAPGTFIKLGKVPSAGSLEVRKQATGATAFYWRFTINGKSHREEVGLYDSSAPPKSLKPTPKGYSVAAAMDAAESMAKLHKENLRAGGYPALQAAKEQARLDALAAQQQARAEAEAARVQAEDARMKAARFNLQALLGDYADHLETLGRRSHADVRSITRLHVIEPWPEIAALPAADVTTDQIADLMRRTIELGKGRTGNKLRSYVRAAYEMAKTARSNPTIPLMFKGYGITHNPASDAKPDANANRADKNPLSAAEMRIYWQAIKVLPGFRGAVLRLHLLTGSQRIEQLVALRTDDVVGTSITLFDGKGRPGKPPRPHTLPLVPLAVQALEDCAPQGVFAISTDGGKTHLAATTLSRWAVQAAGAAGIADFQTKRLRSGVETLLASARVSSDIRGRLQSHGVAGVQARHYDGHSYVPEKLAALETLHRLLDEPVGARVVQFKAA